MLWFESLLFYGCEEQEQVKDDADISLLPTIVERVVLPKLTGIGLKNDREGVVKSDACLCFQILLFCKQLHDFEYIILYVSI